MPNNDTDSVVDLRIQRASERVRSYLLSEFAADKTGEESRLPSIKALARHLDVSAGTVQTVMQKLASEGIVRIQQGSGSFLVGASKSAPKIFRALVSMPITELKHKSGWLEQIGGGIFAAALRARPSLTLEGIAPETFGTDSAVKELLARKDAVDGLLLMPYSLAPQHSFLLDAFEEAGKPVITLYAASLTATSNFVAPDFFGIGRRVGRAWAEAGRKRVAMLRIEPTPGHFSIIEAFQLGIISGLGRAFDGEIKFQVIPGGLDWNRETAYQSMKHFLANTDTPPDAVFCENDVSAEGAIQALEQAGLSLPDDVSVIAGSSEHYEGPVNRYIQPLATMGERAVELLMQRILLQQSLGRQVNLPGEFLISHFKQGSTVSRMEERLLSSFL